MDKLMLCLANSYKHGGRCIAGIELAKDSSGCLTIIKGADGTPKWLRPISHSFAGEISNYEARNIKILSVIKIVNIKEASLYSHTEDIYYERIEVTKDKFVDCNEKLDKCIDNYHRNIFGNRGRALTPECFQNGNYSVMLIKVHNAEVYLDKRFEKTKERVRFVFYNSEYDFPITDPLFLDKLKNNSNLNKVYDTLYMVLSLGVVHEGWHSKLVASIIEPITNVNNIIDINLSKSNNVITEKENNKDSNLLVKSLQNKKTPSCTKTNDVKVITPIKKVIPSIKLEPLKIDPVLKHKTIELNEMLSDTKPETNKEGCYIATMVYGDYNHPQVVVLRNFRDNYLLKNVFGRKFVSLYYRFSPKIVRVLRGHKKVNSFIRKLLNVLIDSLS